MYFDPLVFRRDPSPEEISAAREEIERQELAIAALEQQVLALNHEIARVKRTQSQHKAIVARCKGVTTLARRMPEELLAKVFEHCVVDGWTRAPIVASHVCSTWRKAAMSPRVWSHIYLDGDNTDALGRTRFWLSMARHAPLHINVVASWRTPASYLQECMKLLKRHSTQWETLKIDINGLFNASHVVAQCCHAMPFLRRLETRVEVEFDGVIDGNPERFDLASAYTMEQAPNLRELLLTSNVLPEGLTLPQHITTLTLEITESPVHRPLSVNAIMTTLEALPCLEHLTLSLPLYYEHPLVPEQDPDRVLSVGKLTSLTMYGPTDLNGLLAYMYLPTLRRLHLRSLEDMGFRQEPIGPTLLSFLQSSNPPLELLELHDIDLSPDFFSACFAILPNLRELRLHESSISDGTLQSLWGPNGFCPRLTRLDLRWCGQLSGKALVNLIRSRLLGIPAMADSTHRGHVRTEAEPIEEVAVLNCCFVEERDVLDLARMTVCRVSLRDNDYCGERQCCENTRYRLRLRLRHMATLTKEEKTQYRLIV